MLLLLLSSALCSAQGATALQTNPVIVFTPNVGPPTTTITVGGGGFDPYAAVDIYFDMTDLATAVTNGAGGFGASPFTGISIQVPRSAVPGNHWITVIERQRVRFAQKQFLVRTDWPVWHYDSGRTGANPYENVLSPANVGSLSLNRMYELDANPQPVVAGGIV
jgi:hypothetical protein